MNQRMMTAMTLAAGGAWAASILLPGAQASSESGSPLTLTSVREVRLQEITSPAEDQFTIPGHEPGLVLAFSFTAPDGKRLIAVQEPTSITAVDSIGRDLTDLPKPQWGEPSHIEMGMSFDEAPPQDFSLKLAVSDRTATSFNLSATLEASVFETVKEVTFTPGESWGPVGDLRMGEQTVMARVGSGWMGQGIQFQPVEARQMIQSLNIRTGGTVLESSSSSWDEQTIIYSVDGEFADGATVALKVRQGFEILPLQIELKDQPLP